MIVQVWDINQEAPAAISGQVNMIVASHSLHHADHLPTSLHHIREALQPGGFLLFQELTGVVVSAPLCCKQSLIESFQLPL